MRLAIRTGHVVVAMLVGFVTPGCAMNRRGTEPTPVDAVKAGQWGGQHIAMTVSTSGTDIEFDCGKATVSGAIDADQRGAFSANGTFVQERPGPTTPEGPPKRPMRLSGTVKGDEMQVTIAFTDKDEDIGTFTLNFGGAARLIKCR
jgi:hypothetical protein